MAGVGQSAARMVHVSPWRSCGLMDKALVFGTKDCRFESWQDQKMCHTCRRGYPMFKFCLWWSCGLMDKALVFGTKDCRLESCQDQQICATLATEVLQRLQTECLVPRGARHHSAQRKLGNAEGLVAGLATSATRMVRSFPGRPVA